MGGTKAQRAAVRPTRPYLGMLLAGHGAQTGRGHIRAADGLDLFNSTEFRLGQQLWSNDKCSVTQLGAVSKDILQF